MKRFFALLLVLLTLLCLAACGGEKELPVADDPVPEVTAAPAPVEPTVEPTVEPEPTPAGVKVELSPEQQAAANLCMSNFSEQGFCRGLTFDHYDASEASVAQLFQFAHLWAKINSPRALSYSGNYETMTRETFYDIVTPRLSFREDLAPVEGEDYSEAFGLGHFDWDHVWYEDGLFYYPAGDGESYTGFSVVDEAYQLDGQTWRFCFTAYELDLDIYWDNHGIPSVYYQLTPETAAKRVANGEITALYTGSAVCTSIYWESSKRDMYRLEHYELDPMD